MLKLKYLFFQSLKFFFAPDQGGLRAFLTDPYIFHTFFYHFESILNQFCQMQ